MKYNFRKIASVLASVVMVGSTIGLAAAANYPAPFVQSGAANVAIVYGSGAAFSDQAAAGELKTSLGTELAKQGGTTGTTGTASGGESVALEKSNSKINLAETLATAWGNGATGIAVSKDDLPTLLGEGLFYNKQNTEYKYDQKIDLGAINFSHFADSDNNDNKPTLGFNLAGSSYIANYTLTFRTDAESSVSTSDYSLTDLEGKNIKILGKEYYILDFKNNTNALSNARLTLLDAAQTATLNEGDTTKVTVGDKSYDVSISFINTDEVTLKVNGEDTEKMSATGVSYGTTFKLMDGTYVGVKSINVQAYQGGSKSVTFSLGSGKLEILSSQPVKINDKSIDDVIGYITLSGDTTKRAWNSLTIKWITTEKAYLTPGKELLMPGFKAIKFTMTGVTVPNKEITKLEPSADTMYLKTTIKDGDVSIPLYYIDQATGNITGVGHSATAKLGTTNLTSGYVYNATSSTNEGFVASWNNSRSYESYYLQASMRTESGINYTTIKNKVTDSEICTDKKPTETCSIGNSGLVLTINALTYVAGGDRLVNMSISSGGSFRTLFTAKGMTIYLPWLNTANQTAACTNENSNNQLNIYTNTTACYPTAWNLSMAESDKDGNLGAGKVFKAILGSQGTAPNMEPTVTSFTSLGTARETESGSKIYESYAVSDLATRILHDKGDTNQYKATIEYHAGETYANVLLAAPSVTVSGNATDIGNVIVSDAQVSSVANQNLIVVGGSCINAEAQKILGVTAALCAEAFTEKTGVSAGQALIQVVASPENSGKIAMLVAGYEADDTTKAVKWVTTTNPSTDKGKTVKLSTSTAVTSVVQ